MNKSENNLKLEFASSKYKCTTFETSEEESDLIKKAISNFCW
jgi:hypothetical protein